MFNLPHVTSQCNCRMRMSALRADLFCCASGGDLSVREWFYFVPPDGVNQNGGLISCTAQ